MINWYNIPHTDNMDILKASNAMSSIDGVTCNANAMIGDGAVFMQFHWLKHLKVKTWLVLPKTKTETKRGQDLVWFKDISVS